MSGFSDRLARVAVEMSMAHQQHQPDRSDKRQFGCKGRVDPLTGAWCQFHGTAREQHEHVVERVSAAIDAATRKGQA